MRSPAILIVAIASALLLPRLAAQQEESTPQPAPAPASVAKTRVYISESDSWEFDGGWGIANGTGAGLERGGARPQTAEIIKTFNQRCPDLTITNNKDKATYTVILDHEGGTTFQLHRNKIAVFNRGGDAIFTDSTLSVGASVANACNSIRKDIESQQR